MESTSQETNTSCQQNQGSSLSALMDAIALQEQCFEQSLCSQQLWSQQLAKAQEASIKAAVQTTTACAAEVDKILKGENIVASEVGKEEFKSERRNKEREPELHPSSREFSRSESGSTSLFHYPEVYKERRRYSQKDHVSERHLGSFDSYSHCDDFKDHHRTNHRENICCSGDKRLHERRRSPTVERSWNRKRSPSKSELQRYFHEDVCSPRSGSLRCQSGDDRGRYYRRACRSPVDDNIPHHGRSIDSRKHRERRSAASLETGRSFKSREFLGDTSDHRDYHDEKICELTGTRRRYESKETMHGNSWNHTTSETLNVKSPCLASVCISNLQDHIPSASPVPLSDMAHAAKTDRSPTKKVGNGPERMRKSEHGLDKRTNACTKLGKAQETDLKDMIGKKKELDEISLIKQASDSRDAKEHRNYPMELTCYPLPEWGSKQESDPQGRKELGRKHHKRHEREESAKKSDCLDAKLEARIKARRK